MYTQLPSGHKGLITAIHPHPGTGTHTKALKGVILTASLDWSVKLWSPDLGPTLQVKTNIPAPTYDYVSDVQWSPTNPGVFVTVTSGGVITLWNLIQSDVQPVDTVRVSQVLEQGGTPSGAGTSEKGSGSTTAPSSSLLGGALNKICWAPDGRRLFLGDSKGSVRVFGVTESAVRVRPGDENKLEEIFRPVSQNGGASSPEINHTPRA